jgi:glutamyl-Q tRNA(Asp) synthetase
MQGIIGYARARRAHGKSPEASRLNHFQQLLERLPPRPVTRFAPSPTGRLHLGHVVNAVWTWGIARALGGTVVLRMEDHDRGRCRPEFEDEILEDLAWLGLRADRGERELRVGTPCAFRQSDTPNRYEESLAHIASRTHVYGCACSRRILGARIGEAGQDEEVAYDRHCATLGRAPAPPNGVRVALPDSVASFDDALLGPQQQHPARQCGDLLVRERNGSWTYQWCVVVDDLAHGVDLVVRGEDLLASTGRQILLGQLLGAACTPHFLHHPLLFGEDGRKLSKRDGATGIRELRDAGTAPEAVLGEAARRSGLLAAPRMVRADELPALFLAGGELFSPR